MIGLRKPLGLLSILDEESTFPNGTDLTFAEKLKQHLSANICFKGERGRSFGVSHFAGEVMYDTSGFLEKNRDLLHMDSIQLLSSCACYLPQIFASKMLINSEKATRNLYRSSGADNQKLSVATKFKGQLFRLMQRLEATTPHFIRCIKPNNLQLPSTYDQELVLSQLRCCGVLEIVRISRSGYPTRITHQKFAERYGFLLLENVAFKDPLTVSVAILYQFNILPEMYQVGYTKLFFRTGQIAELEDTRNRTLHGILRVQSCFRAYRVRCYVNKCRRAIIALQSFIQGEVARKEFKVLRQRHQASIIIQQNLKSMSARKKFFALHDATIVIQSVIRGWLVRRCSGDIGLLNITREIEAIKEPIPEEKPINSLTLTELQHRLVKAEAALREKEEENDILQQRLQLYENRWSEYENKMRSMEEVWQKQMKSLQCSLSLAKKSLSIEVSNRTSEGSVGDLRSSGVCEMDAGLNVIGRLAEEFEQRSMVFGDDAEFLVEVKSGKEEASLNPERELRRLKMSFEAWKKDYRARLRDAKAVIQRLGSDEENSNKVKKKWWGRSNGTNNS